MIGRAVLCIAFFLIASPALVASGAPSAPKGSLVYSTYLGGLAGERGRAVTVDASGNAIVVGWTHSADYPTAAAYDPTLDGNSDGFITKVSPSGSSLVFSTFLGGISDDAVEAVTVDGSGNIYVAGHTSSSDFPTTPGVFDTIFDGSEAFVAELSSAGQLIFSTFLGCGAQPEGIYVDPVDQSIIVAGYTSCAQFPVTQGSYVGQDDAFVIKLAAGGTAPAYSLLMGGAGDEYAEGLSVDASGNVFVGGTTFSADFPATRVLAPAGGGDAFVVKLSPLGPNPSAVVYSTVLGGSKRDSVYGLAADPQGRTYITGETISPDFPTTAGAFSRTYAGPFDNLVEGDAFVTQLSTDGSALLCSTFLGGSGDDEGGGIALDSGGRVYVDGTTCSQRFPTTTETFDKIFGGSCDAFVAKFDTSASGTASLMFSSYLGGKNWDIGIGLAVDADKRAYITGTAGAGFTTTSGAFDVSRNGGGDAYLSKMAISP